MKTLIIKSLLTSPPEADQRESCTPLWKRGVRGDLSNDALPMNSLEKVKSYVI
jgi:hypothetical protein